MSLHAKGKERWAVRNLGLGEGGWEGRREEGRRRSSREMKIQSRRRRIRRQKKREGRDSKCLDEF